MIMACRSVFGLRIAAPMGSQTLGIPDVTPSDVDAVRASGHHGSGERGREEVFYQSYGALRSPVDEPLHRAPCRSGDFPQVEVVVHRCACVVESPCAWSAANVEVGNPTPDKGYVVGSRKA